MIASTAASFQVFQQSRLREQSFSPVPLPGPTWAPQAADVLAILRARPDLKIVGVNAKDGAVTILSGRIYLAHSLADVVECLE